MIGDLKITFFDRFEKVKQIDFGDHKLFEKVVNLKDLKADMNQRGAYKFNRVMEKARVKDVEGLRSMMVKRHSNVRKVTICEFGDVEDLKVPVSDF